MRHFFLVLYAFLLLPLVACAQQTNQNLVLNPPPIPAEFKPVFPNITDTVVFRTYAPPEIYDKWWEEIMGCTGLHVSRTTRAQIQYMYIRSNAFTVNGWPEPFIGYSFMEQNRLVVIYQGVVSESLVKHEMIHFLMYHNGMQAEHLARYFVKCHVQ